MLCTMHIFNETVPKHPSIVLIALIPSLGCSACTAADRVSIPNGSLIVQHRYAPQA